MDVVLYMRMSTDKQENSIDSQRDSLTRYAKAHHYSIIGEYIDEGISGRQAKRRPAFLQMIDDSEKEMFSAILVYDSSRFARNLEESIVYKSALKKSGIQLISITEPTLDEDTDLLSNAMLGAINEMYSRKLSKSVKRGMTYQAQQGYHVTPAPFGYSNDNGILKIVENEATIVCRIFDMFINRPSYHGIAVSLNMESIPKRSGKNWSSADIKRMLSCQAYIGYIEYDGLSYQGKHEALIDMNTYEKVQELISKKPNHRTRPESTYKHWLSGLMRCAKCGSRMNYIRDWRATDRYRCSGNSNGRCRYSNSLIIPTFESLVFGALDILIANNDLSEYDYFVPIKPYNDIEITNLKSSLKKVNARLERHKQAYANGIDSLEEYKENKNKCLAEQNALTNQLLLANSSKPSDDKIIDLKQRAVTLVKLLQDDSLSIEQKSNAVKSVIYEITVDKYTGDFIVHYYI